MDMKISEEWLLGMPNAMDNAMARIIQIVPMCLSGYQGCQRHQPLKNVLSFRCEGWEYQALSPTPHMA